MLKAFYLDSYHFFFKITYFSSIQHWYFHVNLQGVFTREQAFLMTHIVISGLDLSLFAFSILHV